MSLSVLLSNRGLKFPSIQLKNLIAYRDCIWGTKSKLSTRSMVSFSITLLPFRGEKSVMFLQHSTCNVFKLGKLAIGDISYNLLAYQMVNEDKDFID